MQTFGDMYSEMLDETYGEVEIAGYSYQTSWALQELDPVAYRCGFVDWIDSCSRDESLNCEVCGEPLDSDDYDDADEHDAMECHACKHERHIAEGTAE